MAITIPERDYLTFAELQKRWQCSENDLSYAIICGELKPSIKLPSTLTSIMFEFDVSGDWEIVIPSFYEHGYVRCDPAREHWYFLQDPRQVSPFDCEFRLASDLRSNEKEFTMAYWYQLPKRINLDVVKNEAVFLMVEIIGYEEKHGEATSNELIDKPLGTTERNSLLKLVIGMAIDGYGYDPKASKSTIPKELADIFASLNIDLSDDTIRKYLKQASNEVLPAKPIKP